MMEFLGCLVINSIVLCFFFFNVPFTTAESMFDSFNGNAGNIRKYLFVGISGLGFGLYKIANNIIFRLSFKKGKNGPRRSRITMVIIDFIIIGGFTFLFSKIYAYLISVGLFAANNNVAVSMFDYVLGKRTQLNFELSEIIPYFSVFVQNYGKYNIVQWLGCSAGICFLIYFINIVYYALMFGFLKFKMQESKVVANFVNKDRQLDEKNLFHELFSVFLDFAKGFLYMINTFTSSLGSFITIVITALIMTLININTGNSQSIISFILDVFPMSDVLIVVIYFFGTVLLAKIFGKSQDVVIDRLPEKYKNKIEERDKKCKDLVNDTIQDRENKSKQTDLNNKHYSPDKDPRVNSNGGNGYDGNKYEGTNHTVPNSFDGVMETLTKK